MSDNDAITMHHKACRRHGLDPATTGIVQLEQKMKKDGFVAEAAPPFCTGDENASRWHRRNRKRTRFLFSILDLIARW